MGDRLLPLVPSARRLVRVSGHLRNEERHGFRAALLAEEAISPPRPLSLMHGGAALQVGQGEGALAVAAVERPKEREQRRCSG